MKMSIQTSDMNLALGLSAAVGKWQAEQPKYPAAKQKQLWALLIALEQGAHLTVGSAIFDFGVYALSQRMGELRGLGWPIQSKMIALPSGKMVKEYWI